jgi:hypothetical protein
MTADSHLTEYILLRLLLFLGLLAPLWLPAVILIYHIATAASIWRFSLRFLFVLIVAECVALGASVAVGQFLSR